MLEQHVLAVLMLEQHVVSCIDVRTTRLAVLMLEQHV